MELKDYTTEQLKAEIKRRFEEAKAERNKIKRCRMCIFFGELTYTGGIPKDWEKQLGGNKSCKFHKTKNGKYYRTHSPSELACEHFIEKQ